MVRTRSSRLTRPKPPCGSDSRSPETTAFATVTTASPAVGSAPRFTVTGTPGACFAAFVRASWTTRYAARVADGDSGGSSPVTVIGIPDALARSRSAASVSSAGSTGMASESSRSTPMTSWSRLVAWAAVSRSLARRLAGRCAGRRIHLDGGGPQRDQAQLVSHRVVDVAGDPGALTHPGTLPGQVTAPAPIRSASPPSTDRFPLPQVAADQPWQQHRQHGRRAGALPVYPRRAGATAATRRAVTQMPTQSSRPVLVRLVCRPSRNARTSANRRFS